MAVQTQIDRALKVWQPYYSQALSETDGAEIVDTMTAYLSIIAEWVQETRSEGSAS